MKFKIEIYVEGSYYGSIRVSHPSRVLYEEEIKEEVERRLPLLKRRKYTIDIVH